MLTLTSVLPSFATCNCVSLSYAASCMSPTAFQAAAFLGSPAVFAFAWAIHPPVIIDSEKLFIAFVRFSADSVVHELATTARVGKNASLPNFLIQSFGPRPPIGRRLWASAMPLLACSSLSNAVLADDGPTQGKAPVKEFPSA